MVVDLVFYLTRAAWPELKASRGVIVNMASLNGSLSFKNIPSLAHTTNKAAIIGMTRQLALEGSEHGIRVNSISPGLIQSNAGSSEDISPGTVSENTQLKGDDVAFAMRAEWKEEPVSTTGAEYVEPSATELIKPGQRVSHLFPRMIMEDFVLQRVTDRVWWVSGQFYGSLFYVGQRGVLLFDPFLGGADATLAAIASVTSLPVTAVVYSHFHADHVGGSRRLFELLAAPPRVIASEHTAAWMSRFRSDLPRPTDVLDWPSGVARFEDVTVRLAGFPFPCHAPDHAMFLIEEERVGHTADVVNVDQLPFGGFGGQEPLVLLPANLEFIRSLELDWFCGGHGNIGEKSDVDIYLNYLDEVTVWDGSDPYMTGNIAVWTAAREQAVDEALPKIIERLRPKYGRMYNFDDAQPGNVRPVAMDIHPTMSNR